MRKQWAACVCFVLCPLFSVPAQAAKKPERLRVLIQTTKGDIEVEIDTRKAPVTAANFLKYVDAKFTTAACSTAR